MTEIAGFLIGFDPGYLSRVGPAGTLFCATEEPICRNEHDFVEMRVFALQDAFPLLVLEKSLQAPAWQRVLLANGIIAWIGRDYLDALIVDRVLSILSDVVGFGQAIADTK